MRQIFYAGILGLSWLHLSADQRIVIGTPESVFPVFVNEKGISAPFLKTRAGTAELLVGVLDWSTRVTGVAMTYRF